MVLVELDPEVDALLRQTAADLEMTPSQIAQVMLESALVMSLTR